jgi:hypothetical protein
VEKMSNKDKIILDLCGGTGAWSKPYKDAGYDVQVITWPKHDVRWLSKMSHSQIYGILAAPPCTEFASSGARWWSKKNPIRLQAALDVVAACMQIIITSFPVFWALENPVGRLRSILGPPTMYFNPCDYGDPYTKKTALWGNFNKPKKYPITPIEGSKIHLMSPSKKRQELRSITPPGFAQEFFKANQ